MTAQFTPGHGCHDCASNPCQCPHQDGGRWLLLLPVVLPLLVSLLSSGCGATAGEAVRHGAARWYAATGITAEEAGPYVALEAWGTFTCGEQTVTGCYRHNTAPPHITIDIARELPAVLRTGAHEWGHHLGLPDYGRGIMGPASAHATSSCITSEDVAMACLLRYDCQWWRPECP